MSENYKAITRREINELAQHFTEDLDKVVLYGEVSGETEIYHFPTDGVNSATNLPYEANQALLQVDVEARGDITIDVTAPATLPYSATSLTFTIVFTPTTITSSAATVTYEGSPCTVVPQGGDVYAATIPENQSPSVDASIEITVTATTVSQASGSTTRYVTQHCVGYITIDNGNTGQTVHSTATTLNVPFTTNCTGVTVSTSDSGISVQISGNNVVATLDKNSGSTSVEKTFTITAQNADGIPVTQSYTITQSAAVETGIKFASASTSVPYTSTSTTVGFTTTNIQSGTIGVTGTQGCTPTISGNDVIIEYPANESTSASKAYIVTISGTDIYGNQKSDTFSITQSVASAILFVSPTGNAGYLDISATAPYNAYNVSNIQILATAGTLTGCSIDAGNSQVVLGFDKNRNSGSTQVYTVQISGQDPYGNTVNSDVFTLTQARGVQVEFNVEYTGADLSPIASSTSAFSVTAINVPTSSITCSVDVPGATVSYDQTTGTITLAYPGNPTDSAVTYTVTVNGVDVYGDTISTTVEIEQEADAYVLELSPISTSVTFTADTVDYNFTESGLASTGFVANEYVTGGSVSGGVAVANILQNPDNDYREIIAVVSGVTMGGRTVYASASTVQQEYVEGLIFRNKSNTRAGVDGTITITTSGYNSCEFLYTTGDTWTTTGGTYPTSYSFSMPANGFVKVYGKNNTQGITKISGSTFYSVEGDIMSIVSGDSLSAITSSSGLFSETLLGNYLVDASGLILSPNVLTAGCYRNMFKGCVYLEHAPVMCATTISGDSVCEGMFSGCTSLVDAPELLPDTTTSGCYRNMFTNCSALVAAPDLPANNLAYQCYYQMFMGCTSLTDVGNIDIVTAGTSSCEAMFSGCTSLPDTPDLSSASTVSSSCFENMFSDCTSLTGITVLPATSFFDNLSGPATSCYQGMFSGCTSLENTRIDMLPATTLASQCYESMFAGCTSLLSANLPTLPALELSQGYYSSAPSCYQRMYSGCTSLVNTFNANGGASTALPATALSESCYLEMFRDCTSLETDGLPMLAASSMKQKCYEGMFRGCTSLTGGTDLSSAATLADMCYASMFAQCTSLSELPDLPYARPHERSYAFMFFRCSSITGIPTDYLECPERSEYSSYNDNSGCYQYMFAECTGLQSNGGNTLPALNESILPTGSTASYSYKLDSGIPYTHEAVGAGLPEGGCYEGMFLGCNNSGFTETMELPASTLGEWCYAYMFAECTNLVTSGLPELTATTMTRHCYEGMFLGCTSIVKIMNLQSENLSERCYAGMFSGCTSLNTGTPPYDLPAWILATNCYESMFAGCTSLDSPIVIEAADFDTVGKQLASGCCKNMFADCTSLSSPNLPTLNMGTLAANCYQGMFSGCTSLETTQTLPAVSMAPNCYNSMFAGCSNLTAVPSRIRLISTLASGCCSSMFSGCTSLTQAVIPTATTAAVSCYSRMYAGCTGTTDTDDLSATTLADSCYYGMFSGCTSLSATTAVLPALDVKPNCYNSMFYGCYHLSDGPEFLATGATTADSGYCKSMFGMCRNLVTAYIPQPTVAPQECFMNMFSGCSSTSFTIFNNALPATIVGVSCYENMFRGTDITNTPPVLPATNLAAACYRYMFAGCKKITASPEICATTVASACCQSMFSGCGKLETSPQLLAEKLEPACYQNMFYECSSLTSIYCLATSITASNCTYRWVKGIYNSNPNGTFTMKTGMLNKWTYGENGVPGSGDYAHWRVEYV